MHAGVVIADHDREALERLCRYGTRQAFAHERLAWTVDGQIAYRLERPWPDGRTERVLPPVAFGSPRAGRVPWADLLRLDLELRRTRRRPGPG